MVNRFIVKGSANRSIEWTCLYLTTALPPQDPCLPLKGSVSRTTCPPPSAMIALSPNPLPS